LEVAAQSNVCQVVTLESIAIGNSPKTVALETHVINRRTEIVAVGLISIGVVGRLRLTRAIPKQIKDVDVGRRGRLLAHRKISKIHQISTD
jgi:hypothetical protein